MTVPIATVVIPALNSERTLPDTLRALNAQSIRDRLHVIVVDNGSTDETLAIAERDADATAIVPGGGCAPARNAGLERARTEFMLSIDADCVPTEPSWAERHLAALSAAPGTVLATAGRTVPKPSRDRWANRLDVTPHPAERDGAPLYAVTGNACFRTEPLRALGGFPHLAADDAGLGVRAREAGYRFIWASDAIVFHANPVGWRGYLRQMRKIGRYGVEINGVPSSRSQFYADRLRYLPGAVRHAATGDVHEATAVMLAACGQALGARDTWR